MIKNIYNKNSKHYKHEYYCDNCFKVIEYAEVYRNDLAVKAEKFDLCISCKVDGDKKQESGGELDEE